ncbi:hypothetical protein [Sphingomonas natans]|uniref:hypothetical protein n=1 Tax=Sphingomonas natans TaxID=3063330 RepID=UPI0026E3083B|nr:hypothetical protein [Sphingomonas sp. BIUV-7]
MDITTARSTAECEQLIAKGKMIAAQQSDHARPAYGDLSACERAPGDPFDKVCRPGSAISKKPIRKFTANRAGVKSKTY